MTSQITQNTQCVNGFNKFLPRSSVLFDPASGISMWIETSQAGVMTDQTGWLQCNNNKITSNCPPFEQLGSCGSLTYQRHTSTGSRLFHSQAVVLVTFLGRSSLQEQGHLAIQICYRQDILKRRRSHFRLRSLGVFGRRTQTGSEHFASLGSGLYETLG